LPEDPDSFSDFYLQHRAEVFRTAYLMCGDREEASDLTQETFARAFQHWSRVSTHERPAAWLQTVVSRLAVSWSRQQAARARFRYLWNHEASQQMESPEPVILRALTALSPAQRRVIVLRFVADRSVDEVARIIGRRPGTVKALTSQGLARMRPLLEAKGVTP